MQSQDSDITNFERVCLLSETSL